MISVIECGGDTDTVGGILGVLAGAVGRGQSIPEEWINGIWEWPSSMAFMRRVATRLAEQKRMGSAAVGPVSNFWSGLIPRNLLFIAVVMLHGFRGLAPPY